HGVGHHVHVLGAGGVARVEGLPRGDERVVDVREGVAAVHEEDLIGVGEEIPLLRERGDVGAEPAVAVVDDHVRAGQELGVGVVLRGGRRRNAVYVDDVADHVAAGDAGLKGDVGDGGAGRARKVRRRGGGGGQTLTHCLHEVVVGLDAGVGVAGGA